MRIISGRARGVRLKTPDEDLPVRPTGDRVKEAMFSAIQFDIKGNVLDLFAGTGQLGL
ncbi:MAG: RsmD family RNA methyltransferase, partial [Eubacteriales bacterium]|nr:RsmD family RNA methyltransferase [Eubacteriales bacterium]